MKLEYIKEILKILKIDTLMVKYQYYLLAFAVITILLMFTLFILRRKRAEKQYIMSGLYFLMDLKLTDIETFLKDLYGLIIKNSKSKYYFSLEMIKEEEGGIFLMLYLDKNVYKYLPFEFRSKYKLDSNYVGDNLRSYLAKIGKQSIYFEMELKHDFVLPIVKRTDEDKISQFSQNCSYYIQLVLRPVNNNWNKSITSYIKSLNKGKDETKRWYGCLGSFSAVLGPIFDLFDKTSKRKIDIKFIKKADLVAKKLSSVGFEMNLRGIIKCEESETPEEVVEGFLDYLNLKNDIENGNYLVTSTYGNVKNSAKDNMVLRFCDKDTIDLVNEKEISLMLKDIFNS